MIAVFFSSSSRGPFGSTTFPSKFDIPSIVFLAFVKAATPLAGA
jgi:hypothetical protein